METEQINKEISNEPKRKFDLSTGNAIVVAGVLIALAIIVTGNLKSNKTQEVPSLDKVTLTKDDHIVGSENAPIVLIEYSDIDCPYCRVLHPSLKKIKEEYGDQVAWVYRDFPLDGLHPDARSKAIASECVAINEGEDAYFTYLDYLFANEVAKVDLSKTAVTLGFNQSKFDDCITKGDGIDAVETDVTTGKGYGIQGTPFTLLLVQETGEVSPIRGAVPYEDLKNLIDTKLTN